MSGNTKRSWKEGEKVSKTLNSSFEADLVAAPTANRSTRSHNAQTTTIRHDLYIYTVLHEQVDTSCHSFMSRT
jgi:hypothetical protein